MRLPLVLTATALWLLMALSAGAADFRRDIEPIFISDVTVAMAPRNR